MSTETFLDPNASLISCDVFVREKVLGPEDVVYDSWLVVISIPAYVQEREDSGTWQNVTVDFAEGNSMKRTFSVTGLWRYELWPSLAFDTAIRYHDLMQKQETGR